MTDTNSYAKTILGILFSVLDDVEVEYPELSREFARDKTRLSSAVERHGIEFVLDVMPAFRKHFDSALDMQRLTASHMIHFGPINCRTPVPRLLRGLMLRVFDYSGNLLSDPDLRAIYHIRQILGCCRKMRIDCGPIANAKATKAFYELDQGVALGSLNWSDPLSFFDSHGMSLSFCDLKVADTPAQPRLKELLRLMQAYADIITASLGEFSPSGWRQKHGPGVVSDQKVGCNKYIFPTWPERLEAIFPIADFGYANYRHWVDDVGNGSLVGCSNPSAKLRAVPKTIRKPRLIACEPTALQYCQQSIRDYFYSRVRSTIFSNFLDFKNQGESGSMALKASIDGSLATIDLSEASDRISCWCVERLFRRSPSLLAALSATRSTWIQQDMCKFTPSAFQLKKYSTMGNATTFPVQSLLFLCACFAAMNYGHRYKPSYAAIRTFKGQVRVFGDDIIISNTCSGVLIELLEALGLKINTFKTFYTGKFRESCGVDAFMGCNVTSINVLSDPRGPDAGSVVSTVDVHHNLCDRGYLNTAKYLRGCLPERIRNAIRTVEHRSGFFGWSDLESSDNNLTLRKRFNRSLQVREVRCLNPRVKVSTLLDQSYASLLQFFTEAPARVKSSISTLGYAVTRPKVILNFRWVTEAHYGIVIPC